jgi:hypothetical protein
MNTRDSELEDFNPTSSWHRKACSGSFNGIICLQGQPSLSRIQRRFSLVLRNANHLSDLVFLLTDDPQERSLTRAWLINAEASLVKWITTLIQLKKAAKTRQPIFSCTTTSPIEFPSARSSVMQGELSFPENSASVVAMPKFVQTTPRASLDGGQETTRGLPLLTSMISPRHQMV